MLNELFSQFDWRFLVAVALIVIVSIGVYGLADLLRFSIRRAWAISSTSFAESIRRRVLWVLPLAMLGIVGVSLLSRGSDEQDAVRQIIQYGFFTSGLIVVITSVILACTSLPKDIETKVVFTVVTKPVTRLEIILGKIIGIARVSAVILIAMGLFTWGYVHLRAWQLERGMQARLDSGNTDAANAETLRHHLDFGLLATRSLAVPSDMEVVYEEPGADKIRWASVAQTLNTAFEARDALKPQIDPKLAGATINPGASGLQLRLKIAFKPNIGATPTSQPDNVPSPFIVPTSADARGTPQVIVQLMAPFPDQMTSLFDPALINEGRPVFLSDPTGTQEIIVPVAPQAAEILAARRDLPYFFVQVASQSNNWLIGMRPGDVSVIVPGASENAATALELAKTVPERVGVTQSPVVWGLEGRFGMQVPSRGEGVDGLAILKFRGLGKYVDGSKPLPMEFRAGIERSDDQITDITQASLQVRNASTGKLSDATIAVYPENNTSLFTVLPADGVAGGDFDLLVRSATIGHTLNLAPDSTAVVVQRTSFLLNLFKGLFALWLLSVLVITIAVFCSTFVNWPIAVVLTLVVLLGRWTIAQVADTLQPGFGRTVAGEAGFGFRGAGVVSQSVEYASKVLLTTANYLPDVSRFGLGEPVQRGLTISMSSMFGAVMITLAFGLPLTALAYVLLRNKEVAP